MRDEGLNERSRLPSRAGRRRAAGVSSLGARPSPWAPALHLASGRLECRFVSALPLR
jgi:hypothetical protein